MNRAPLLLALTLAWTGLLSSWFTPVTMETLKDELMLSSSRVPWVLGALNALSAVVLLRAAIVARGPQAGARLVLPLSLTSCGTFVALALGSELPGILFGAVLGFLAGGLAAVLLDWEDEESSKLLVSVYIGVAGLFFWCALLGWLIDRFPALRAALDVFFSWYMFIAGGLAGVGVGMALTHWLPGWTDRAFKQGLAVFGAGASATVAWRAIEAALGGGG